MTFNVLTQEDLVRVRDACLTILERIGFNLGHPGARDLMAQHGCRVDGERVRVPGALVEKLLTQVPRSFYLYGRGLGHPLHYGGGELYFRPSGGMPYMFDFETGERRNPRLRDAQDVVRILDALPNYQLTNSILYPKDIPPEMVSVVSFVNTCQFTDKPSDATLVSGAEVRAIARIAAVVRGSEQALREKPLTLLYLSPTSPLRYSFEQAEAVLEIARAGMPLAVLPIPLMGISSPITLAGALAQQTAEVLSGLVMAYLVNPGIPFVHCARASAADMHTGAALYGSPETGLACAATAQIAHFLGMPTNGFGLGSSGKAMDEQVGFEKALNGLAAALSGCDLLTGGGLLEDSLSMSYQQLVIDDEIISMIRRFVRGIKVNEETLGLEGLEQVMNGSNFLAEPHTRKHFRAGEIWQTSLVDRKFFHEWQAQGARRIEERAADRVREILAGHQVEPLAPEVQREIDAILKAVERELVPAGAH